VSRTLPPPSARIPTAILMSGTGSNARRLLEYRPAPGEEPAYQVRLLLSDNPASGARAIAEEHGVPYRLHDIYRFCAASRPGEGLGQEQSRRLRDPERRQRYDRRLQAILRRRGVRLVALAGYDWVVGASLCRAFVIVNVHPGDLRVRDAEGRRRYTGLGWVPSAKAILNGEPFLHVCTHLVTAQLDGGPIARVSRPLAVELPPGAGGEPQALLPPGVSLAETIRGAGSSGHRFADSPLVTLCRRLQQRLKETGDWVEFPLTLHLVAGLMQAGRLGRDRAGELTLDGRAVPELFLMGARDAGPEAAGS
jgi:folate-dependent phosphoribosylglycinamide formyltransferase PurN